jgi:hypothetical protein
MGIVSTKLKSITLYRLSINVSKTENSAYNSCVLMEQGDIRLPIVDISEV